MAKQKIKAHAGLFERKSSAIVVAPELLLLSKRAKEVFGDAQYAAEWLDSPNPTLSGKTPAEASETPAGLARVQDLLGRLQEGVY